MKPIVVSLLMLGFVEIAGPHPENKEDHDHPFLADVLQHPAAGLRAIVFDMEDNVWSKEFALWPIKYDKKADEEYYQKWRYIRNEKEFIQLAIRAITRGGPPHSTTTTGEQA